MRWKFWVLFAGVCWGGFSWQAQTLPPLSETQRIQLETADDTRPPDEPAWYGLLEHVAAWDPERLAALLAPDSERCPLPPPLELLHQNPTDHRGQVFLIEGRFAGRQRRQPVLRAGPWGRALTEWGVVVDPPTRSGAQRVAIVYLTDPDGRQAVPRRNQRVRLLGRFYKLWADTDGHGNPQTYPVFVGQSAVLLEPNATDRTRMLGQLVFAAVAVLVAGLVVLRWWARRRAPRRLRPSERLRAGRRTQPPDPAVATDLPDDPAEALAALNETPADPSDPG